MIMDTNVMQNLLTQGDSVNSHRFSICQSVCHLGVAGDMSAVGGC